MENRGHIYVDTFIDCGICGNERRLLLGGQRATTVAEMGGYNYRSRSSQRAEEAGVSERDDECPTCGSDLERVTCPNCGGVPVEHATGWACGECDEDGEVLVCVVCDGQQAHVSGSVL